MQKNRLLILFSFALALLLLNLSINPVFATELFSDGFESGDFSAWDGEEDTGNKFVVGSTVVHHGSYAAELANGVSGKSYYVWKGYTQQLPVYARVYLRLADLPDSSGDWICFLQLGEAASLAKATSAFVKHDGTSAKWFLKNFGYGGSGYGGEVSTDTWYCAEVKRSSTEQVLYINGSVEVTISQAAYGSADEVRVGAVANNDGYGLNGFSCTAYFDCVVVADTYIGEEAEGQAYTADLSQSVSSTWNILTETDFNVVPSQSLSTSWDTLTEWDAIADFSQAITSSWDVLSNLNTFVDLSQSLSTTWNVIMKWNAIAGLSQILTTSWQVLTQTTFNVITSLSNTFSWLIEVVHTVGGQQYFVDLSQAISTTWTILTQWNAITDLTQPISTSWQILTQSTFQIAPSLSLTTSWIVNIIKGTQHSVDLTLSITTSWVVDVAQVVEVATGYGLAIIALVFGIFGIALALLTSSPKH